MPGSHFREWINGQKNVEIWNLKDRPSHYLAIIHPLIAAVQFGDAADTHNSSISLLAILESVVSPFFARNIFVRKIRLSIKPDSCNVLWDRGSCNPGCNTLFMATCKKSYCAHNIIYCARNIWLYSLDIVQDRLMFLFRSSAVEGTYSLDPVFFFPLFGINSLTHSPLAAAISLKHLNIILQSSCI